MSLRADFAIISSWIKPGTRVLDLGCGDGTLMHHLQNTRQVSGYGLEIDVDELIACVGKGVNVIQTDLDKGLSSFASGAFDYVIMTEALQVLRRPDELLDDMLRVGRRVLVTFPNVGHWRCRLGLGLNGRMPMSRSLPNQWYNTPNIHLCTVRDFDQLCHQKGIEVIQRSVVDFRHRSTLGARLWPNLLGEIALYELRKPD